MPQFQSVVSPFAVPVGSVGELVMRGTVLGISTWRTAGSALRSIDENPFIHLLFS